MTFDGVAWALIGFFSLLGVLRVMWWLTKWDNAKDGES